MILLFGGTTEAKQVASWLEKANLEYIYSTKTQVDFEGKGLYRHGALNKEELEDFCQFHGISSIINACHPFATQLHQTVASATTHIPIIRFERFFPERIQHPLVHYVQDYASALQKIEEQGFTSLLALTGVQSIPKLSGFWQKNTCWFRILDRAYSKEFAAQHSFPIQNLIFGLPQKKEEEILLFQKLQPSCILTKESGSNGKLEEKIEATIACNIPILIIGRPSLPDRYKLVRTEEELLNLVLP